MSGADKVARPRADVRVSDHALLKFLERVGGYDIEGLRSTIAWSLQRALTAANQLGTADLVINADGMQYVVCNGVVVTVVDSLASRVVQKP